MKYLKIGLLFFSLQPLATFANISQDFYIGVLGGVGNVEAVGLHAAEPAFTTSISPIKNTAYPFLYGAQLGYDWCSCAGLPISTELMYLHMNKKTFKMSNVYPLNDPGKTILYSEYDSLSIQSNIFLFNAIYYWADVECFKPFLGAGIGFAQSRVGASFYSTVRAGHEGYWRKHSNTKFVYDLLIGLSYTFCSNIEVSLAFQYLPIRKIRSNDTVFVGTTPGEQFVSARQLNMSNILFGIKKKF